MSTKHECSATVFGPRVHSWKCTRAGTVERNGKWWCKQHDPLAVDARRANSDAMWKAKRKADDAIYAEGHRIAKAMGVEADVSYHSSTRFADSGPSRHLKISFDDCLELIERLEASE